MDDTMARAFPPTRHSAVAAVRSSDAAERARGLAILSAVYWQPVYTYLRLRWRKPREEAADLAQELFVQVVQNDLLARFDPSRARLRTFLRACVDGLVANHHRAAARQKRGGGAGQLDFDGARDELERLAGAGESPDLLFGKEWARAVFSIALQRLEKECAGAAKSQHYALLQRYDLVDERPTYAELAQSLGIAVTDLTNRLFRARRELRRVVLEVLRELTVSEEEFREEVRALLGDGGCDAPR